MKKTIMILLILINVVFINVRAEELDILSKNAILYGVNDNEILYEKNSDEKVQIASLTKIMTALVVLDSNIDLNSQLIVKNEDLTGLSEENLVTAGFTVGQVVTYRDLLYGLLLPSGADAARVIEHNFSDDFIRLMNDKATSLKLKNTHFSNSVGLDDENNYSTVSDLLVIFKEALKNEEFKRIITSKEYTTSDGKLIFKSTIQKNARKYGIDVSYIEGGKTGTTDGAGLCLASIAKDEDEDLILITTGSLYDKVRPHHLDDSKTIYDFFIQNYDRIKIVDKNKSFKKLKTKYATEDYIKLYPERNIIKYLPKNYDENDVIYKYEGKKVIKYNDKGEVGILKIYYKDKLLDTQSVKINMKLKFSIKKYVRENLLFILAIAFIFVFILIVLIKRVF